jgi:hypothetical protein
MLLNVEMLSEQERRDFSIAQDKLKSAEIHLKEITEDIGRSHGMTTESYMEWRSWVSIDGKYILYYRK